MDRLEKQKLFLIGLFSGRKMYKAINAMNLAVEYHNHFRKSGEPEVSHQFELVSYAIPVFEYHDNLEDIVCSLFLHDIVEDYNYSLESILRDFGENIHLAVKNLTKPVGFRKEEAEYEEYYKPMESDAVSIICKIIDRLHNLESMLRAKQVFNLKKREAYINEVMTYMIPTAKIARRSFPEYYQKITFLIRTLKTYCSFLEEYNELEKGKQ